MTPLKLCAAGLTIVLATLALALPAPRAETVAAVFPPWWPPRTALAAAASAGPVVGVGSAGFVVVVRAPEAETRRKLRRAGALALIDPSGMALCGAKGTLDV